MILRAENISKIYRQGSASLEILKGVSIEIAKSETVAIMGRSGCGKSTLISLLAGLDVATSGDVEIAGRKLGNLSGRQLNQFRAQSVGIIFQQFHLLDHLTALENIRLPLDLNSEPDADQRAAALIGAVGLSARAEHFPGQMSRGECQRIAIARVLVRRPQIVLADEPTGSLDVRTGREVMDLIFRLTEQMGCALLLVTHDRSLATRCSRTLYMDDGRLTDQRPAGLT